MNAGKEESALNGIYSDEFKVPRDAAQDALDQLEVYNHEQARLLKEDINQLSQQISFIFFIITLIAIRITSYNVCYTKSLRRGFEAIQSGRM